uniref:Uncharacterized protein n=1 Tax=Anguilla anguilla TaxID=7936 RepID=A0A0E9RQY1_ANGAN
MCSVSHTSNENELIAFFSINVLRTEFSPDTTIHAILLKITELGSSSLK